MKDVGIGSTGPGTIEFTLLSGNTASEIVTIGGGASRGVFSASDSLPADSRLIGRMSAKDAWHDVYGSTEAEPIAAPFAQDVALFTEMQVVSATAAASDVTCFIRHE